MGRGFVERATCGLYQHFSRPLASFCRWSFLKNIFGLMSSTVGIAVSVTASSVSRRFILDNKKLESLQLRRIYDGWFEN